MIKKYVILKFGDEDFSVGRILSPELKLETEYYSSSFLPEAGNFYLVIYNERTVSKESDEVFKNMISNRIKFLIVVSVISYKTAVHLYGYTPNLIFMPANAFFIEKKITEITGESLLKKSLLKRIIFQQFDNIRHLQKIFAGLYRFDPLLKNIILNITDHVDEEQTVNEKLIADAEKALKNGDFQMYFQPVVDIATSQLSGFESLIRWNDPVKGMISPDDFIPVLETTDFIFELTYWIIEEVIKFIAELNKTEFSGKRINVNICAKHFHLEKLVETIESFRERYGIEARQLGVEITESAFMEDMKIANLNLLKLKSLNYPLYMDDFGTGYSSLSYLQHFPVEIIKIDKSFVRWMHVDEQSELIVKSIIALAHGLNMKVVAEGVEEDEHIGLLKEYGCEYGQGYLFSKPLDKKGVLQYIDEYRS
ncbi:MAG: EAL domain-containing protein [Spirochaetes bacterium]|nr:EAL domain-containing protein [Spirochaetota bacterium]